MSSVQEDYEAAADYDGDFAAFVELVDVYVMPIITQGTDSTASSSEDEDDRTASVDENDENAAPENAAPVKPGEHLGEHIFRTPHYWKRIRK